MVPFDYQTCTAFRIWKSAVTGHCLHMDRKLWPNIYIFLVMQVNVTNAPILGGSHSIRLWIRFRSRYDGCPEMTERASLHQRLYLLSLYMILRVYAFCIIGYSNQCSPLAAPALVPTAKEVAMAMHIYASHNSSVSSTLTINTSNLSVASGMGGPLAAFGLWLPWVCTRWCIIPLRTIFLSKPINPPRSSMEVQVSRVWL